MPVRRMGPDDADVMRRLRLRALQEAPSAFGSTYDREAAFSDQEWLARLSPDGYPHFLAEDNHGEPVGMVVGAPDQDNSETALLLGLWVAPEARRQGWAALLVDEVLGWARSTGVSAVRLHVTEGNSPAEHLYERCGFASTGRWFVRDRDGARELEMELRLRTD
ncbi:MAG TPA: GNAT family N-acetyltransferase [Acidimicrobiales bacterium]|nr:GNAT family N-acetyltransferase [Acidimicrobiales bacterium]